MGNGIAADFLSPKEITSDMGVDYKAFLRKLRRGEGPRFKRYGAKILIRKIWYEEWLASDHKRRK